ncbi:MAG TPA: sugar ABC transporter permease [Clostridia bacterium]
MQAIYKEKKKKATFQKGQTIFLVTLLAIPVLHWLIFWLYININSIILAFQNERGEWSLINFVQLWDQLTSPYGETVGLALKNTLLYFLNNLFIIFPLSIMIAFFIFKHIKGYKIFRIIFFLPAIISGIAMTTVYTYLLIPNGPLDVILSKIGLSIPAQGFFNNSATATPAILVYTIWTGFSSNIILIGGAMSRIPTEVLESAKMEGCGPFREIVSIVLPLTWSTLQTMIVFTMTSIFMASGPILLFMPDGGYETTTISFWIFKQVYGSGTYGGTGQYGLVSCAGFCFTLIGVPIILFVRKLFEKVPAVEY